MNALLYSFVGSVHSENASNRTVGWGRLGIVDLGLEKTFLVILAFPDPIFSKKNYQNYQLYVIFM
jgi:hypothetical protein